MIKITTRNLHKFYNNSKGTIYINGESAEGLSEDDIHNAILKKCIVIYKEYSAPPVPNKPPVHHALRIYPGGNYVGDTIIGTDFDIREWLRQSQMNHPMCVLYIDGQRVANQTTMGPVYNNRKFDTVAEIYFNRIYKQTEDKT